MNPFRGHLTGYFNAPIVSAICLIMGEAVCHNPEIERIRVRNGMDYEQLGAHLLDWWERNSAWAYLWQEEQE